jgi:hypothetical protein
MLPSSMTLCLLVPKQFQSIFVFVRKLLDYLQPSKLKTDPLKYLLMPTRLFLCSAVAPGFQLDYRQKYLSKALPIYRNCFQDFLWLLYLHVLGVLHLATLEFFLQLIHWLYLHFHLSKINYQLAPIFR